MQVRSCLLALVASVWLWSGAAVAGPVGELVPVEGISFSAQLQSISTDWDVNLRVNDAAKSIPAANIVSWGTLPAMISRTVLLLADGGQIACNLVAADRELLNVDSPILGQFKIPLSFAAGLVFAVPSNFQARDELLKRVSTFGGDTDRLLLENGDVLTGSVRLINHEAVELESAVGHARVELVKVLAISFNPALRSQPSSMLMRAIVGLDDGSWFGAAAIAGGTAAKGASSTPQIKSVTGWSAPVAWDDIVFLQPFFGRVEYLSNLEARGYKHIPFLSLNWPFTPDRSVTGGLLRFDDVVYPKGLGMHSASRVTYALQPTHKRFEALIALDATSGHRGSATFRVFVDNQQRFASPVVRGGDNPVPISVDVAGGKLLSLIVDFADHGDELDHANWLNARLVK